MMWIIILGLTLACAIACVFYLISRIGKFAVVDKLCKSNKKFKRMFGLGTILLIAGILAITIETMNMIIVFIYMAVFWIVCDLVDIIVRRLKKTDSGKANETSSDGLGSRKPYYAGIIAIVITCIYLSIGWYNAFHVSKTAYNIDTTKELGGKLKIALIADSHVGTTFHWKKFGEHMKRLEAEKPDVILVAGDFVDDSTTKEDMVKCSEILGKTKSKYGTYFVYGNHDKGYYGEEQRGYSAAELEAELLKNGIVILEDESVLIDDRFYIIGRQDSQVEDRASMKDLVAGLDATKFSIVMDHEPQDYDNQESSKVDLVLSGHTHGGQLIPITYVGEWIGVNDKTYGYEKRTDTNFIVTSGISDWAIKFKTGCKSEYVIIECE